MVEVLGVGEAVMSQGEVVTACKDQAALDQHRRGSMRGPFGTYGIIGIVIVILLIALLLRLLGVI